MKVLRYIIPVVLAVLAFMGSSDKMGSIPQESPSGEATTATQTLSCSGSTFTLESDLYLPSQVSYAGVSRTHNSTQRVNFDPKKYLEYIKAGKIMNIGVVNGVYKELSIISSSFTEPVHRLISLGKLVI